MQSKVKITVLIVCMLFLVLHNTTYGHGFASDTLVQLGDGSLQTIHTVCLRSIHNKIAVSSYNVDTSSKTNQLVKVGRRSQSNCYMRLGFDVGFNDSTRNDIVCTPMQEFYMPKTRMWIHAYTLKVGDALLTKDNIAKPITYIQFVQKPLTIYMLEIKKSHTFFVGKYLILTHNMMLPMAFNVGLSVPFGTAAMGTAGSFFGPIGLIGGVVLGGIIGLTVRAMYEDRIPTYTVPEYDVAFINTHCYNVIHHVEQNNDLNHYVIQFFNDVVHEPLLNVTVEIEEVSGNNVYMPPKRPKKDDEENQVHPNGIYKGAKYHHQNSKGLKSPAPKNGQKALDCSVKYKEKSRGRVGISEGEIVIFSETLPGEFHGHVRTWSELLAEAEASQPIRNALMENGLVNSKGKILK